MLNSNYIWIIGMCLITLVIMLVIMPGLIDYLHKIKHATLFRPWMKAKIAKGTNAITI